MRARLAAASTAVLLLLPMALPLPAAAQQQPPAFPEVLVVTPDLDGDGIADVVGARSVPESGTVEFRGRRGLDGTELWLHEVPGQFGAAIPVRIAGGEGILVLTVEQVATEESFVIRFRTGVVDLAGDELWLQTREGAVLPEGGFTGLPLFAGVVDGGEADLVLLGETDLVFTPDGRAAGRVRVEVVDATDGAVVSTSEQQSTDGTFTPVSAPDLDGDGAEDYAYAFSGNEPPQRRLIAHSSATGEELWDAEGVPFGFLPTLVDTGDLDGDGIADVATSDVTGGGAVATLSGADGAELWTRPSGQALALGDISGDGTPEVGVLSWEQAGDVLRVGYEVVDTAGATVAEGVQEVAADADPFGPPGDASLVPAGDIDGDGTPDAVFRTGGFGGSAVGGGAFSGANAATLWTAPAGQGLGVPFDGSGNELLRVDAPARERLALGLQDGETGALQWRRSLPIRVGGGVAAAAEAADLDGDGQPDLVINAFQFAMAVQEGSADASPEADWAGLGSLTLGHSRFSSTDASGCGSIVDGTDGTPLWSTPEDCLTDSTGPGADDPVVRVAGAGRVETAVAVSRATRDGADTAVLARADAYPDALAGAPLARQLRGPLLFVGSDEVPEATADELGRLGVSRVLLLGGPGAISPGVQQNLEDRGYVVRRVGGTNRFDTAALVAAELRGTSPTVVIAEGEHADPTRGWPDALAAAPYAANLELPMLLVNRDRLPAETAEVIDTLGAVEAVVVGGPGAVSDAVVADLRAHGLTVTRVAGPDRYATAVAVRAAATTTGSRAAVLWLGTGLDWPDALAAGAAVAALGDSFSLVDGVDLEASPATAQLLRDEADTIALVRLLGGTAAISQQVEQQIRDELSR